jgi:hypothetical protein
MVDSEGIGFKDFTMETAISGTASISGNVVAVSGIITVSGSVSIFGDYIYKTGNLVITNASGGQALGNGLTTSGFTMQSVTVKIPDVKISGTNNYGFYFYSGSLAPVVYIGGYSGSAPYAGGGSVCSGKGIPLAPGEKEIFYTKAIDNIYAVSEVSGNSLTYIIAMR